MLKQKMERDDDSKKSHHALIAEPSAQRPDYPIQLDSLSRFPTIIISGGKN